MPLIKSSSKPAFVSNLKAELAAGKPRDQALAIAYAVKRRKKKRKGYADGGAPDYGDIGGALPEAYADPNVGVAPLIKNAVTGMATLPQRAIDASGQDIQNWNDPNYVPQAIGPAVETALTMMGGSGAVPAEANSLRMGIKAYHGSPHDFDAFDLSKIGTGEGAQAYGHGLYFAGNEKVAQGYRDALATKGAIDPNADMLDPKRIAAELYDSYRGQDIKGALDDAKYYDNSKDIIAELNKLHANPPTGHMYQVDINADPEHFLDWDKPLSEQSPQAQDAVKQAMGVDYYGKQDPAKAERMWQQFKQANAGTAVRQGFIASDDKLVADRLNQAGIPGIKYLDQGSRAAGDGSRNYVVFNDKLVNILRKYGIAGLPAGAAAAMAAKGKDDDKMNRGGSVNAAMDVARRAKRAKGGKVHVGPIIGDTGGRADKVPMDVPDGGYILTADLCSALGEGNTLAGFRKLNKMFPKSAAHHEANRGGAKRASGGKVPIQAAHGEYSVHPSDIIDRWGDLDHGHQVLDAWQTSERQKLIHTLKHLDPPAQD